MFQVADATGEILWTCIAVSQLLSSLVLVNVVVVMTVSVELDVVAVVAVLTGSPQKTVSTCNRERVIMFRCPFPDLT